MSYHHFRPERVILTRKPSRLRQQREADLQRRQAEAEERERRYRPLTEHARTLKLPQLDEDALNAQDEVTFDLLWNRQLAFQVQGPRDSEETSIAGAAYGGLVESWYGDLPKRAEDRLDAPEEDSAPENSAESDPCIPETRSCRRCSRVDTNNMVVCSASSHSKDTSSFWYHYRCVGLKTATVPKGNDFLGPSQYETLLMINLQMMNYGIAHDAMATIWEEKVTTRNPRTNQKIPTSAAARTR